MFPTGPRGSSLPYAVEVMLDPSGEEILWIADGGTGRMLKYDLEGNFLYGWGTPGNEYGHFNGPHSITTDQAGNLYISEVFAGRVQKFVPRAGADVHKIVGQQLARVQLRDGRKIRPEAPGACGTRPEPPGRPGLIPAPHHAGLRRAAACRLRDRGRAGFRSAPPSSEGRRHPRASDQRVKYPSTRDVPPGRFWPRKGTRSPRLQAPDPAA